MISAGKAGVDMLTDMINQMLVEGLIPPEWDVSKIVSCYKGKGNSLERERDRRLKLTD